MNDSSLDVRKVTGTIFLLGIISILMIQVGHQKHFFNNFISINSPYSSLLALTNWCTFTARNVIVSLSSKFSAS